MEPVWVEERETLVLHDRLLALHGGAAGLRDAGLLKSALSRPMQIYAYGNAIGVIDLASAYTTAIIRNDPFVDGNKRTGFVAGILFLELNGYHFLGSEEDTARAILELTGGTLDEAGYTLFLRSNTQEI